MLPSLITTHHPLPSTPSPEDILSTSLSNLFPDDLQNIHGNSDPETSIIYASARHGDLVFRTADPEKEDERRKFAHYLWNAGVLLGELVGGRPGKRGDGDSVKGEGDGVYKWDRGALAEKGEDWWWVSKEEEQNWKVAGERVLELGAGVGLAGIVSALAGAKEVTITDYPAPPLLATLKLNVEKNIPPEQLHTVTITPHEWGDLSTPFALSQAGHYTRILAADTLWLTHEHLNLLKSMTHFLSPEPSARVFVIAGFHTGRAKVAMFFDRVGDVGLEVEEIWEMDANGVRRGWERERDGGRDDFGDRKRWVVLARLRRVKEGGLEN